MFFPDWPKSKTSLPGAVAIAKSHQVPVVVDAAGRLDVPGRLQSYVATGPDLVIFSGGKHIRGPQASGFICGRRDLISAIAWQHLDMDVTRQVWTAPRELLAVEEMPFIPRQGIGRGFKAGKEEIVGLVTALRLFTRRDHAAERAAQQKKLRYIVEVLAGVPHVQPEFLQAGEFHTGTPHARIKLDERALAMTAYEFMVELKRGDPPIHASERELAQGAIVINPFGLVEGDEVKIVERVREIVARRVE